MYVYVYRSILVIILTLVFFYIIDHSVTENLNEQNNKISVVIPCIPRDIKFLERLLQSIKNQTSQAHEVIIAISGINNVTAKKMEKYLREKFNLPIKITNTLEKKYASENRNRGAKYATGNILSFMDADDIMYPQKLFYVNKYFNLYNPKMFLHGFSRGYNHFKKHDINPEIRFGIYIYDSALKIGKSKTINDISQIGGIKNWWCLPKAHHGHISIPRSLMDKVKYREGEKYKKGQDSLFIRDILHKYGRKDDTALFVDIPLSQYISSDNQ
jgi:glycosyltransferase involved in cell wall biosynthesis